MALVKKDFIEKRVSVLPHVPSEWEAGNSGYKLNFKMCQIQKLRYDFYWGDERDPPGRSASIVMMPSKILVLDLSLNELQSLDVQSLEPYRNLKHLDASLNRIDKIPGVEVLRTLFHLNLSNNFLITVDPVLGRCKHLHVLDLSMNQIDDISYMPRLSNVVILHLNNNKLRSLDGIQALSHIRELHVQRNQLVDIVPVASALRLTVLNASENNIGVMMSTVDVVSGLKKLQHLSLHGNPIANDPNYSSELINHSNIIVLDNVHIKPLPKLGSQKAKNPNVLTIKDAAKQAFYDVILDRKRQTEEKVRFLQERIRQVQADHDEWEDKVRSDMDQCGRYLDSLTSDDLIQYDPNWLRDTIKTPTHDKPWQTPNESRASNHSELPYIPLDDTHGRSKHRYTTPDPKPGDPRTKVPGKDDYSAIKEPDEVLRHAYNELAKEYTRRHGTPGERKD